jgi:16S rRNA (adenine1518-N6/adenine1519-N6)-dimethyltransferase
MGQRLGQHFLHDRAALRAVVAALELAPGDTIVEIGAGHGELTHELLAISDKRLGNSVKVVAIEKDMKLAALLRQKFAERKNFELIEGDAREALPTLTASRLPLYASYKLCGNIPYYLTGFLFRLIGELNPLPSRVVLTIQKEVAERVCAQPPHTNQLSASVQFWAEPRIIRTVPRGAFSPPPKVASAIVALQPRNNPPSSRHSGTTEGRSAEEYYAAVHALFCQPRKTLVNNISAATGFTKKEVIATLAQCGIAPAARPGELTVAQIIELAGRFPFGERQIRNAKYTQEISNI